MKMIEGGVTAAFTAAFGSDTWLFVLFVLVFAAMVNNSGASRVIANWMASRKFAQGKPWVISGMLLTIAYVIGALISVTPGIMAPLSCQRPVHQGSGSPIPSALRQQPYLPLPAMRPLSPSGCLPQ